MAPAFLKPVEPVGGTKHARSAAGRAPASPEVILTSGTGAGAGGRGYWLRTLPENPP